MKGLKIKKINKKEKIISSLFLKIRENKDKVDEKIKNKKRKGVSPFSHNSMSSQAFSPAVQSL